MKNHQHGTIGIGALIAILGLTGVVFGALIAFASYVSAYNFGNTNEAGIKATWENNQNILGQYTLKIGEMVQVPGMYKDDLKDVVKAEMEGRYGSDGSRGVMQWIQERNLQIDSSMYTNVQQAIEAGRNEFQTNQTRLVDQKRIYQTELGSFWSGFWLRVAGYPKIDLEKYKPVVAGDTAQAFETGVQAPIKLR